MFLALTANVAILHSATQSSAEAAATTRALEIATEGMELAIAQPEAYAKKAGSAVLGAGTQSHVSHRFERSIWTEMVETKLGPVTQAIVLVKWNDGSKSFRLERYVRNS